MQPAGLTHTDGGATTLTHRSNPHGLKAEQGSTRGTGGDRKPREHRMDTKQDVTFKKKGTSAWVRHKKHANQAVCILVIIRPVHGSEGRTDGRRNNELNETNNTQQPTTNLVTADQTTKWDERQVIKGSTKGHEAAARNSVGHEISDFTWCSRIGPQPTPPKQKPGGTPRHWRALCTHGNRGGGNRHSRKPTNTKTQTHMKPQSLNHRYRTQLGPQTSSNNHLYAATGLRSRRIAGAAKTCKIQR